MDHSISLATVAPNALPLPSHCGTISTAIPEPDTTIGTDLFPKGDIVKFFPNQAYGFMRDHIGRELFFHLDEVDLLGPRGRREFIRVGLRVGFDCCRTSHGLRVKRMKVY